MQNQLKQSFSFILSSHVSVTILVGKDGVSNLLVLLLGLSYELTG